MRHRRHREFWIAMCTFNDGYTEIYKCRDDEFDPPPPSEKVHVIEYFAYADALKKIDALKAEIKSVKIEAFDRRESSLKMLEEMAKVADFSVKHLSSMEQYSIINGTIRELNQALDNYNNFKRKYNNG